MKLAPIKSCFECFQRARLPRSDPDYNKVYFGCRMKKMKSLKGIIYSFPAWCPLQDYNEEEIK